MNKKAICAVMAFIMFVFSLSACGKKAASGESEVTTAAPAEVSTNEDGSSIAQAKLGYCKNDSLSPYEAETEMNIRLDSLLYDPLFVLDASYNPTGVVAKGCVNGTTTLNVMLDTDYKFSDGTSVTAQDIIYSFETAKESDTYSTRLANFESVTETNSSNLVFTLSEADIFAQNCLTFPIIKQPVSSAGEDAEDTSDDEMPIGTGRYVLKENAGRKTLEINSYRKDFSPSIVCFELTEIKDSTVMDSSLEIGSTCFCFDDLSDGSYSRVNAGTKDVTLNNLVYIGFNSSNEFMENSYIRQAVSAALDRASLCTSAFQGHAKAAETPFNPDWYVLSGAGKADSGTPESCIEQSGLSLEGQKFSIVVNKDNGYKLELANQIAQQLSAAGIDVYVSALAESDYYYNVSNADYDMYIGEVRLTENMDLSPLFRGGRCAFGMSESMQAQSYERYEQMLSGECELMDFVNIFSTEMPFVPVCYRTGLALYTNLLDTGEMPCSDCDVYLNVANWTIREAE